MVYWIERFLLNQKSGIPHPAWSHPKTTSKDSEPGNIQRLEMNADSKHVEQKKGQPGAFFVCGW